MPFAFRNPVDQQEVSTIEARRIEPDFELGADEVYVDIEELLAGYLWDAQSQSLRPVTEEEARINEIVDLKQEHKTALADRAGELIGERLVFPTMGLGDREVLMILATTVKQICQALGVTPDERIALIADAGASVLDAVNRIEAVPTDAEDAKKQVLDVTLELAPRTVPSGLVARSAPLRQP
jgi:hypothetical protein